RPLFGLSNAFSCVLPDLTSQNDLAKILHFSGKRETFERGKILNLFLIETFFMAFLCSCCPSRSASI
ncbi:MAG: hypothetical protein KDD35_06960, partial [Bdellovibrionales bacterium]|nr:hypothetical protein [Bdellovibrionales bacterium]